MRNAHQVLYQGGSTRIFISAGLADHAPSPSLALTKNVYSPASRFEKLAIR
ncbi:hypothetical protein COLO4_01875 [Corchorus olitorius]|uniref:Uncharacterized protein n=1 Tax=Corchorus olitorius TaxID=93759 RepID=A0A1R3L232_9ROSI|nr:hypothetical protein COLO4_01875 [Corchorus olitorius]